nr:hypothetical protein [uncultured Agathobaculum sp.]
MKPEIKQRIEQIHWGEVPEGYVKTPQGVVPADWKRYTFGDIYAERKEPGNDDLPLLMVSIHSGVSDGEVDEAELPKRVKRIKDKSQYKNDHCSGGFLFRCGWLIPKAGYLLLLTIQPFADEVANNTCHSELPRLKPGNLLSVGVSKKKS